MGYTLFTLKEAAEHSRLSLRAFERLRAEGKGPVVTKLGGKFLVRSDHLAEWIEAAATPPNGRGE